MKGNLRVVILIESFVVERAWKRMLKKRGDYRPQM
jgi:hypothetical protein